MTGDEGSREVETIRRELGTIKAELGALKEDFAAMFELIREVHDQVVGDPPARGPALTVHDGGGGRRRTKPRGNLAAVK